jgi:hypothetical protein
MGQNTLSIFPFVVYDSLALGKWLKVGYKLSAQTKQIVQAAKEEIIETIAKETKTIVRLWGWRTRVPSI